MRAFQSRSIAHALARASTRHATRSTPALVTQSKRTVFGLFKSASPAQPVTNLHQHELTLTQSLHNQRLSEHDAIVRELIGVYLQQGKSKQAQELLWRLVNELTGQSAKVDSEAKLLHTVQLLHSIINLIRHEPSGLTESDSAVLTDLLDRYNTIISLYNTDARAAVVINHPTVFNFLATLARSFLDIGEASKAQSIIENQLLFDESEHPVRGENEDMDGAALRLATANNYRGILAYQPPAHVHTEACSHDQHHHHHDISDYDWSNSRSYWTKSLEYCAPFIGRLKTGAVTNVAEDSVELYYVRVLTMIADNLSQAQFTGHQHTEAVDTLRNTLSLLSPVLPPSHMELLRLKQQLILLLLQSQHVKQAEHEIQQLLLIDHRQFDLESASVLESLGQVLFQIRHLSLAGKVFEHCIHVRESALNDQPNLQTAARYNDLGMCQIRQRQFALAAQNLKKSVEMKEAIVGKDHPDLAVSVHNLGTAQMGLGQLEEAEQTLTRALQLYQHKQTQLSEENNSHGAQEAAMAVAILHSHCGQLYRQMKKFDAAVAEFNAALTVKRQMLGGEHGAVAQDLTQLGGVLMAAQQYSEAVTVYEELLRITRNAHGGVDHANIAISQHFLSNAQRSAGMKDEALQTIRQAVELIERVQLPEHVSPESVDLLRTNLALQLDEHGQKDKAEKIRHRISKKTRS